MLQNYLFLYWSGNFKSVCTFHYFVMCVFQHDDDVDDNNPAPHTASGSSDGSDEGSLRGDRSAVRFT